MEEKSQELEVSLDRVAKKQKLSYKNRIQEIDSLIQEVHKKKQSLDETNEPISFQDLSQKIKQKDVLNQISKEHKEYHAILSKFGKTIDKNLNQGIMDFSRKDIRIDLTVLNEIISQHFYRQGKFELAEFLIKESNLKPNLELKEQFNEMYVILDNMSKKNLFPAMEWARKRVKELEKIQSDLEFQLHKIHFINLLTSNKLDEALTYSRTLSTFSNKHMKEIGQLMACLLWINRLEKSPYAFFTSNSLWQEIADNFASTFCALLNLSFESPLYTTVTAGSVMLPKYLKLLSLTQGKNLKFQPIEVDVEKEFKFHPIFACPVSREQTTPTNPPVMLICGHVISKASVQKLARGASRFKCPYCPVEQKTKDPIPITF